MVDISIVCLIYKSVEMAEAVYNSLLKHTPKIKSGEAEFFFIANDPTEALVEYFEKAKIPYHIKINETLTDDELFKKGFGKPEYIRRVYQGYNYGILKSKGQKIVLINSDNFFSDDWLENLLKYLDYNKIVSSTLVEPGQDKFPVFEFAIEKNFGQTLNDYDDDSFNKYANKIAKTGYSYGGAYMPCILYKDIAILAGLYPEGNIAKGSFEQIEKYGDQDFYARLERFGVKHITSKDSVVYHLKEGEKSILGLPETLHQKEVMPSLNLNTKLVVSPSPLLLYVCPDQSHQKIMQSLGEKLTIMITYPKKLSKLKRAIRFAQTNFNCNKEIIIITDKNDYAIDLPENVRCIYTDKDQYELTLFRLLHLMYGELLLIMDPNIKYSKKITLNEIESIDATYYLGVNYINGLLVDKLGNFIISRQRILNDLPLFVEKITRNVNVTYKDIFGGSIIPLLKPRTKIIKLKALIIYCIRLNIKYVRKVYINLSPMLEPLIELLRSQVYRRIRAKLSKLKRSLNARREVI